MRLMERCSSLNMELSVPVENGEQTLRCGHSPCAVSSPDWDTADEEIPSSPEVLSSPTWLASTPAQATSSFPWTGLKQTTFVVCIMRAQHTR